MFGSAPFCKPTLLASLFANGAIDECSKANLISGEQMTPCVIHGL
jgi:hypothetical protein